MKTLFFQLCLFAAVSAAEPPAFERIEDKANVAILTPSLQERKTAKIRLPNGLEAYLISDPGVDQSAAAIAVEAGSWLDPKEYPGMAHFLEHMLFMGNKAYPNEFEYMQFVSDHGGSTNAFTASDRTVYMFSINNDAFDPALDRFAHFFIDPLFLPNCINRELHAVDQEHAKNIEDDDWRQYMILKETGNPAHPNAAFSTGNAATLSGIPQEALKKWYREHYSAGRMRLVAISSMPLDDLVELAAEKFSAIQNTHAPEPSYPFELFSPQQKGHITYIKPVRDLKSLALIWQPPKEFATDLDHHTMELVAYALRSGSETGLIEQLKKEKLAETIKVGSDRMSKEQSIFLIDVELTEEGTKKIDTVIERVFQAIARLKEHGIPSYLFDEMKKMSTIGYQYQSREEAFSFIMHHGASILSEKMETYPIKGDIPSSFSSDMADAFLATLTPSSCVFFVTADPKLTNVATTAKEKWMDAEYAIREIPESQVLAWSNVKPNPSLQIPPPNPYIPQNLALQPISPEAPANPILLASDPGSKIYFAQDSKYLVPQLCASFHIKTPLLDGSSKSLALFDLYLRALSEKLFTPISFAHSAGLSLRSFQKDLSLGFILSGYNDKAPLFLKTLFHSLSHITPSAEQFEIYKQSLLSDYDNASKELPVRQASETLSSIIFNDLPTNKAKYAALKGISHEEFLAFSSQAFKKAYCQGMLYGNMTPRQAAALWADVRASFPYMPYSVADQTKKSVLVLPDRHGPYLVCQNTERQGNGVILMLQEGNFSFERRAAQQILSTALQNAFFDTLRTKQQTAYIAKSWDIEIERQLLQLFAVQSITHQPQELLARFELFLEEFNRNIPYKISEERFQTIKGSLVKTLEMPPENLDAKTLLLDTLAFTYDGDFQWIEKRIEGLKNIPYNTFTKISHEFLSRENLRRLAVLMEGIVPSDNAFRYEQISLEDVRGIGKFVSVR